jgi:hypothetical protein
MDYEFNTHLPSRRQLHSTSLTKFPSFYLNQTKHNELPNSLAGGYLILNESAPRSSPLQYHTAMAAIFYLAAIISYRIPSSNLIDADYRASRLAQIIHVNFISIHSAASQPISREKLTFAQYFARFQRATRPLGHRYSITPVMHRHLLIILSILIS